MIKSGIKSVSKSGLKFKPMLRYLVDDRLTHRLLSQVRPPVLVSYRDKVSLEIWYQVQDELVFRVWGILGDPIYARIGAQICDQVRAQVDDSTKARIRQMPTH